MTLGQLQKLVKKGEGLHLEFKRKANHPDKIVRELIAFANSEGGTLLIGVDDDGTIYGSKFPEEDRFEINQYLELYSSPPISAESETIRVNSTRKVVAFHVEASEKKPHFLKSGEPESKKIAFVRVKDMSITASREMVELLKHQTRGKGVNLRFGQREQTLLQYLESNPSITLEETRNLLKLPKRKASFILILLVRAGLLSIHPTEKGDFFRLSEEAFLI